MTAKDLLPKPGFFAERLWIWLTGIMFTTVGSLALAAFTPVGAHIVAIWESPRVMADALARIDARMDQQANVLDQLAEGVRRANGDNRVIRQTAGLSYVAEPVYQGEPVVLYMVAERTTLGRDCRLIEWVPLFTDVSAIAVPGESANPGPPRRQISTTPTRLRIEMVAPDTLAPGRVELYLALTYDCGGTEVYDRTDPVIYQLLAGPRP